MVVQHSVCTHFQCAFILISCDIIVTILLHLVQNVSMGKVENGHFLHYLLLLLLVEITNLPNQNRSTPETWSDDRVR